MKLREVEDRVMAVGGAAQDGDEEEAHHRESTLHRDVLGYVADNAPEEFAGLARAALLTLRIPFVRSWGQRRPPSGGQ